MDRPRRKPRDGTYETLPSGRVRYTVMRGYHPDGRRDRVSFTGPTEADCRRQWLEHQIEERQHGRAADRDKRRATLDAFAEHFAAALDDEVTRRKIGARTRDFYVAHAAHLTTHYGALELRDVGADHLERLYTRHADQPRTALAIHQTARRLFKMAKRHRWITYDPTDDVDPPTYKSPERTPPTGAELRTLLDQAERTAGATFAAVLALACVGLRPGEVLGLDRGALHLDDAYADVVMARDTRGAPTDKPVKSERSLRRVPLTRRTVALLRAHFEAEKVRRLTGPVFCTRAGRPLRWRNVYRSWPGVRDAAKLPKQTRPYDLRHAFVSELLAEGVPLHEVSWLAGHASVHFTADRYGHRVERRDDAARSALERAMRE